MEIASRSQGGIDGDDLTDRVAHGIRILEIGRRVVGKIDDTEFGKRSAYR